MGWLPLALLVVSAAPSIEWSAPPTCPDRAEVERHLTALLTPQSIPERPPPVSGRVFPADDGFELRLDLGDDPPRVLHSRDCSTLAQTAVLVIAIELDSLATTRAVTRPSPPDPSPEPEPAPTVEPAPTLEPRVPRRPSPTPTRPRPPRVAAPPPSPPPQAGWHGLGRVRLGFGRMGLPRPSPIVGGALGVGSRRARAEALGELHPTQSLHYPGDHAGADLWMAAAGLRGCAVLNPDVLEIPLCAGLWIAALGGRGRGVTSPQRATDLWVAPELAAALAWRVAPQVAIRLGAAGTVALRRPSFTLRDRPVLFRAPRLGVRLMSGVEVKFSGRRHTKTRGSGD